MMKATWSLVVLAVAVAVAVAAVAAHATRADDKAVIASLRDRLSEASRLVASSEFIAAASRDNHSAAVQCTCHDYCLGNCFSLQCAPCAPSAFAWPGGRSLCFNPGPLGTGLLCHVDAATGAVTARACCTRDGPTCVLPRGSCCEHGGCSRCPASGGADGGDHAKPAATPVRLDARDIFPWLNTTAIAKAGYRRRRVFVNSTCRFA